METKKANMPKTLDAKVDKILIWMPHIGETTIEDPTEIKKIVRLVQRKAERYKYFIDSPQLTPRFRIQLYNGKELLERIAVTGDFLKFILRNDKWYLMRGLGKELYKMYGKYVFS